MTQHFLTAALALIAATTAIARPAYPGVLYATMQDGARVAYHMVGDEHGHACITLDGRYIERITDAELSQPATDQPSSAIWRYTEAPASSQSAAYTQADYPYLAPTENRYTSFPTIGEVRGLVLLVEFEDIKFKEGHDQELYHRQLNEEGYCDYDATGSARDYFIAQSSGLFRPQFDVVGPVKLSHPEAYYGANQMNQDSRPGQMVVDACQYAHDSLSIDFSQYDYDNDGNVDFVFCVYAGYGENYGAPDYTIWPHMSRLKTHWLYCDLDGKSVDLYACSCELKGITGSRIDGIGALCHEFGHVLGLPDFYNTRNQTETQLGHWDVMDSGSYNNDSRTPPSYTAFERHMLGWLDFIELVEPADSIFVPEITQSNMAYRITTPDNPDEFFTLENHQQTGWDAAQGGRGLMIIHVSYEPSVWASNGVNSTAYPHYDLIEADGTAGRTFETDLYPTASNDMFTDYSRPNSLSWAGVPTGQGVTHITQHPDGQISFRFMNDRLSRPTLFPAEDVTDTSFVASWQPVEDAIAYRLHVLEELPDTLNPLLISEDFSLVSDEDAALNISTSINDYVHTYGWLAEDVFASGGMVRLGSYGTSGSLTTPIVCNTSDSLTVLLKCCAYTGKSVNYSVTLLDAEGYTMDSQTFKANRNMQTPVIRFGNTADQLRVRIESNKERLYIDDIRIASGHVDSLALWGTEPRQWDVVTDETRYEVTGLTAGCTYHYHVTALDPEPLCNSLPSDVADITLPLPSGIETVVTDPARNPQGMFDLTGRPLGHDQKALRHGCYISGGRIIMLLSDAPTR